MFSGIPGFLFDKNQTFLSFSAIFFFVVLRIILTYGNIHPTTTQCSFQYRASGVALKTALLERFLLLSELRYWGSVKVDASQVHPPFVFNGYDE